MEVEKESGELVVSKLQVPNQPSFPLQNFIHNMITCLALALPPKYVFSNCVLFAIDYILSVTIIIFLDLFRKNSLLYVLNGY